MLDDARPIFLYAGRVAVEKNIEAFLALDLPGTKWVVGDGPARNALERRFPGARFFGMKTEMIRRGITGRRTRSCFPAAPTRSGW